MHPDNDIFFNHAACDERRANDVAHRLRRLYDASDLQNAYAAQERAEAVLKAAKKLACPRGKAATKVLEGIVARGRDDLAAFEGSDKACSKAEQAYVEAKGAAEATDFDYARGTLDAKAAMTLFQRREVAHAALRVRDAELAAAQRRCRVPVVGLPRAFEQAEWSTLNLVRQAREWGVPPFDGEGATTAGASVVIESVWHDAQSASAEMAQFWVLHEARVMAEADKDERADLEKLFEQRWSLFTERKAK
jgi:hypothetical protein